MDFLRSGIRRTKLGEIAYVIINAILPIVLLFLVRNFTSPYLALALILLSKWRVFALRPRFWWINFKANLVDYMVGVSYVALLYFSMSSIVLQIVLMLGYMVWLLYIKPRSDDTSMMWQAGISQFLATIVLFSLSTSINEIFVVLGCWGIGYASARHVMANYEEDYAEFLSSVWGLVISQLGWISYRWTTVYDLGLPVKVPQIALLVLIVSFVVARLYGANKTQKFTSALARSTILLGVVLIVIVLLFSRWDVTV